jgi:predicted DNA binding CopG/RHH family protein
MRPLQRFSKEYLEATRGSSLDEIARFLEDFRLLHAPGANGKSRLISLRVPEPLLASFKARCRMEGSRYQTRIKELMTEWLGS